MVYIAGTPGTGKTSLAGKLAERLEGIHVELGKLSVKEGLTLGYDKQGDCAIIDVERLEDLLKRRFSRVDKPLIFEAPFLVKLKRPLTPKTVFILRCNPRKLAERLKAKGYKPRKVMNNLWAEILDYTLQEALSLYPERKLHEIDVTDKSLDEVLEEALSVLEGKQKPSIGEIRWLSLLEREGLLEKLSTAPPSKALRLLLRGG